MSLFEVIKQYAESDAIAADWTSVVAKLTAANIPKPDTTLRTTRWLMKELTAIVDPLTGATEADLVLGTLQKATLPRVRAAYDAMSSDGIDLSDPQVQAMVSVLGAAAGWSEDLVKRIKTAGIAMLAPWQDAGLETAPTVTLVQAAWDAQMDQDERDRIIEAVNEGQAAAAVLVLNAATIPDDADVVAEFSAVFNATRAAQGA